MYIQNRRNSSKFKGCSPLQYFNGLISLKPAIAYFAYTQRCAHAEKTTQKYYDCKFEKRKNGKCQPTKARFWQPIPATVPACAEASAGRSSLPIT